MDALVWCFTELLLGAHLPRGLNLAPALDLAQRSFLDAGQRAERRSRFAEDAGPQRGASVEERAARLWGVSDPYDPDAY
jgi:hypothetical protein